MKLPFDYRQGLYRKNNYGEPCYWCIIGTSNPEYYRIYYGILGKNQITQLIKCKNNTEYNRKIEDKRKVGYKFLNEVRDNQTLPVEEELINYLCAYLPDYRDTSNRITLPMLAKTYDNTNNKIFKKGKYLGQWKINGLRCFIRVEKSNNIFQPYKLIFQSREGVIWNSLSYLEERLIDYIGEERLDEMYADHIVLDGEVYIPGRTVNEINSAVKNPANPLNTLVQYWCYDIAIEDVIQEGRNTIISGLIGGFEKEFKTKEQHLNNKDYLVVLANYIIHNDETAEFYRDKFIDLGFEGLIMRNIEAEYQFGKRVSNTMIKYKRADDGIFTIIDIYPEDKRTDIPLIKCKNDINDFTFECHISNTLEKQREILRNRDNYIGKKLRIEFGERSGVELLPFHLKKVKLI